MVRLLLMLGVTIKIKKRRFNPTMVRLLPIAWTKKKFGVT